MQIHNDYNTSHEMTNGLLLIGSWATTVFAMISVSAAPIILSCLVSVFGIVNYVYQIKNNRDRARDRERDIERDRSRDNDRDIDRDIARDKERDTHKDAQ